MEYSLRYVIVTGRTFGIMPIKYDRIEENFQFAYKNFYAIYSMILIILLGSYAIFMVFAVALKGNIFQNSGIYYVK